MMFGKIVHNSLLLILSLNDLFLEASYHHFKAGLPSLIEGDLGSRLTLQCNISRQQQQQQQVQRVLWLKDGRGLGPELSWTVYEYRGDLVSSGLLLSDAGNYSCYLDTPHPRTSAQLVIRTPPGRLANVTVHPSSVVATVRWHITNDGGYPISHFTLAYQAAEAPAANSSAAEHHYLPVHISPAARQFFVYHLEPGTPYMFRMWASNRLGPGEATTVYASTSKPLDPAEVVQKMFAGGDDFSTAAWMVAVSMVMGTILILSCLSCLLIYKEGRHEELQDEVEEEESSVVPHIVANPGFEVDLEESFLLDRPDCNDNNERAVRTNNNSVVRPSHV